MKAEQVPQGAIDLIAGFEDFVPHFYHCTSDVLTVGYGHAVLEGENYHNHSAHELLLASKIIKQNTLTYKSATNILQAIYGNVISEADAMILLKVDIAKHWSEAERLIKVKLNTSQTIALMSWVFNLGVTNLRSSTLLKCLNRSDFKGAKKEFSKWVYSGGQESNGLKKRRAIEADLFGSKLV